MTTIARVRIIVSIGRKSVDTYLQGRKVTAAQDYGWPSVEVLHLIRKLRWMGLEEEAEQLTPKICVMREDCECANI